MKLQKLTIHNIASIEDAVIDFEAQPLADSEVFLITGKTGAGSQRYWMLSVWHSSQIRPDWMELRCKAKQRMLTTG